MSAHLLSTAVSLLTHFIKDYTSKIINSVKNVNNVKNDSVLVNDNFTLHHRGPSRHRSINMCVLNRQSDSKIR